MNRQPRTLRVCFLAALAIGLTPVGGPLRTSVQTSPERNTLVEVSLMSSDDHVVVALVGSQALSGEIHEITVAPFRVFVDFVNVVPRVDAVTPVNHGGVRQVRVALNKTDPPVTRVVLDLTHRSSYRVEEDQTDHEFRIIVGPAASLTTTRSDAPVEPMAPASLGVPSTVLEEYAHWFARLTQDVRTAFCHPTRRPWRKARPRRWLVSSGSACNTSWRWSPPRFRCKWPMTWSRLPLDSVESARLLDSTTPPKSVTVPRRAQARRCS